MEMQNQLGYCGRRWLLFKLLQLLLLLLLFTYRAREVKTRKFTQIV